MPAVSPTTPQDKESLLMGLVCLEQALTSLLEAEKYLPYHLCLTPWDTLIRNLRRHIKDLSKWLGS